MVGVNLIATGSYREHSESVFASLNIIGMVRIRIIYWATAEARD